MAGQLGENTVLDSTFHPPIITRLHYEFDGWLGDDILESFPCFICSQRLTDHLKNSNLTGFVFKNCEVTKSDQFFDLYPRVSLPVFYWFIVGNDRGNDFFLLPDASLVVSEDALEALKKFQILHCDIKEFIE